MPVRSLTFDSDGCYHFVQIEYNLKRGTTDNSYVVAGADGAALINVPDNPFSEAFVRELKVCV